MSRSDLPSNETGELVDAATFCGECGHLDPPGQHRRDCAHYVPPPPPPVDHAEVDRLITYMERGRKTRRTRHPLGWLRRLRWWRHQHAYAPIAAFKWAPPFTRPVTTVTLMCVGCPDPDSLYAQVELTGAYDLPQITTPGFAGLMTVAQARALEAQTLPFGE